MKWHTKTARYGAAVLAAMAVAAGRRPAGRRAGLPAQGRHRHRALPGGRAGRHPAARHGGDPDPADGRQLHRRQPAGRDPDHRGPPRRRRQARRRDDLLRQRHRARHQSEPQEIAAVRSGEGLRADLADLRVAAVPHRAHDLAGELDAGAHRLRQDAIPASSTSRRSARARPCISPANCSSRSPAST